MEQDETSHTYNSEIAEEIFKRILTKYQPVLISFKTIYGTKNRIMFCRMFYQRCVVKEFSDRITKMEPLGV
ncbi:hypothetical protein AGMMS49942_21630 [Spirochaetia bacterium]|nr:hypothetical protein AGMMS49942_21630 [Spirochaetia bacterium]